MKRSFRFALSVLGALSIFALVTSCGHPASVPECEEIVERIVRLEMQGADAGTAAVADEVRATKKELRSDMMKRCVGRRITDGAMRCVRSATSSQQIEEQCFD